MYLLFFSKHDQSDPISLICFSFCVFFLKKKWQMGILWRLFVKKPANFLNAILLSEQKSVKIHAWGLSNLLTILISVLWYWLVFKSSVFSTMGTRITFWGSREVLTGRDAGRGVAEGPLLPPPPPGFTS